MTKWEDLFEVMMEEEGEIKPYSRWNAYMLENHPAPFVIYNKHSRTIAGRYRDYTYACKQAKRKFKKIVRALERKLLG